MDLSIVEWAGAVFGIAGAGLLSLKHRYSAYGWLLFLASNACWITFGVINNQPAMVVMQIVFTLTSLNGIINWLIKPSHDTPAPEVATNTGETGAL